MMRLVKEEGHNVRPGYGRRYTLPAGCRGTYRRIFALLLAVMVMIPASAAASAGFRASALRLKPDTARESAAANTDRGAAEEEAPEETVKNGGGAAVTGQVEGVGYATQLYDATNGLPTSDANTILATSDGFIWIGGYSGLIRYDGTSFQRQDSSGGITNCNALLEDSAGRLWVGTNDNGLVVTSRDYSRHYDYTSGLPSSKIETIAEDAEGNILVGTSQGMCVIDPDMELHGMSDPQLNKSYINRLVSDGEGVVYGNTKDGAMFRIENTRISAFYNGEDLGVGSVSSVFPDPDAPGYIYIGTENGELFRGSMLNNFRNIESIPLYRTAADAYDADSDGGTEVTENEISIVESYINWITCASGRVWIVTSDLVGYLDEERSFHILENIPLNSNIGKMIEDYEGNLWFTSTRQGVMKIVANKFTYITERAALEEKVVNSTCLHGGCLYIGTDTGLQVLDAHYTPVSNRLSEELEGARIRCLMEDGEGNLWASSYSGGHGLVCLTGSGEIISYNEESGLLDNKTRCTSLASDGSVLAATNGGLNVIKDGEIVKSVGAASGLSNTVILTVAEGDGGKYYLGTDGDGIYIVDGSRLTRLGREDGLSSDVIMRIKKDEERGVYWIISSNSIAFMKDEKVTTVAGFPYTNNYDIYFDDGGNAWVLASNGIYVVKAQDMIDGGKFDYLFYDTASGLPCVPTGNSFSHLDPDGTLYISGRSGVSSVNINQYFEKTHDIKLNIPYVDVDGERYYTGENNSIDIPSSARTLTIYGYAITYSMHNPTIQYMLEGFDHGASVVSKKDMEPVRYTNLRGGEYTYILSLVNTSTSEVQQSVTLSITKEKAFYEELWFYAVCSMMFLFLVTAIVKISIVRTSNAFLKKERETSTYIREMTEAFAKTIDMKDKYTNGHSFRVAKYTAMLAEEMGYNPETVEKYRQIALLHDIGKIGVPPEVLNKPGKLTDDEFRVIQSHSKLGFNVLKDISIMPELAIGAGAHHERPDGKGYPNGLKGEEIPRVAQIIAVADTFDAMYSDRPYRKRMNFEKAVSIIRDAAGTQLTPDVVEAFLRIVEKGGLRAEDDTGGGTVEDIVNIHEQYGSE